MAASVQQSQVIGLVSEVSQLHADLTKSVAVCQQLRKENNAIKAHYDNLRTKHVDLVEKHKKTSKQLLEVIEAKVNIEKEHEEMVMRWKEQLERKARELEELETQMAPPRDLELLKAKIHQQVEAKNRVEQDALQAENEKYRALFLEVRHQHELLKTEFEQYSIEQTREMGSQKALHRNEIEELMRQVRKLQEQLEEVSDDSRLRLALREKEEVIQRERNLRAENEELRQSKHKTVLELETQITRLTKDLAQQMAQSKSFEADRQALQRRIDVLEYDSKNAERENLDLELQNQRLTKEMKNMQSVVVKREEQLEEERRRNEQTLSEIRREWEEERSILISHEQELHGRISELENNLRSEEAKIVEMDTACENKIRSLQRNAEDDLQIQRNRIKELEDELERAQRYNVAIERQTQEEHQRLSHRIETLINDKRKAEREHQAFESKYKEMHRSLSDAQNSKDLQLKDREEIEREYSDLQIKHRELRESQQEYTQEREHLVNVVEHLRKQIDQLQSQLKSTRDMHFKRLHEEQETRLREKHIQEQRLIQQVQEMKKMKASAKKVLEKILKKSEAYKSKLIKVHRRNQRLLHTLHKRDVEKDELKAEFEIEISKLQRQIREMEREQDRMQHGVHSKIETHLARNSSLMYQEEIERYQQQLEQLSKDC